MLVVDLTSDDDTVSSAVTHTPHPHVQPPPPAAVSGASRFCQLRDAHNPERPWAVSFNEMLEPVETVTHVLLSTFGHADVHVLELLNLLSAWCPRLEELCIVSDWNNTGGVGGSSVGQFAIPMLPGVKMNPHYFVPDALPDLPFACFFVFPALATDEEKHAAAHEEEEREAAHAAAAPPPPPRKKKNLGRAKNSIQHTKLLLVRQYAPPMHTRTRRAATLRNAQPRTRSRSDVGPMRRPLSLSLCGLSAPPPTRSGWWLVTEWRTCAYTSCRATSTTS
jgi:hypothetical protein